MNHEAHQTPGRDGLPRVTGTGRARRSSHGRVFGREFDSPRLHQKERHAYSVSFFLGFAGRGPAPPFGDSNARDGRAIPPPRFCLRQNARTPQKRRGPEGPLGKISRWRIENLKYLDCSALPQKKDSTQVVSFFVDSAGQRPASPFGIKMLRAAKPPFRQGFRFQRTRLYGAPAPPARRPGGCSSVRLQRI